MIESFVHALGGVGLFLVGMIWLVEGLRGLAGPGFRNMLARFTHSPLSGAVSGALATALVQSSSATTVTAVGLVSAGLLTFPQALGIIYGANIGTTITGWLVAIVGFKLHLGEVALPLVFVGALLHLFAGRRVKVIGQALAGFSLLFIGIEAIKDGMAGFEGLVTPASFPPDSWYGRLALVLIGIAITLVTQSSSAGVAMALVALQAGTINFPQAASMVIGMDVGTTFTAALATLGGTTATRRTGLSHVIYNSLTGVMAFAMLYPFASLVAPLVEQGDGQIALVAFHTSFNTLGVILVLPFAASFARLVERFIPEREAALTRRLGNEMLKDADAATDAAAATVEELCNHSFNWLARRLQKDNARRADLSEMHGLSEALGETRRFVARIPHGLQDTPRAHRVAAILHILDHLGRLHVRCRQDERIAVLWTDHRLRRLCGVLRTYVADAARSGDTDGLERRLNRLRRLLRRQRSAYRNYVIGLASVGDISDEEAAVRLDAMRWLQRVAYHVWRIELHMGRMRMAAAPASHHFEERLEALGD